MSKLTLDEAIKHCLEVAEAQEEVIKSRNIYVEVKGLTPLDECRKIAADHRQLAEWLTELKELRSLKTDYVFFKAEAKKLLKAAMEDINTLYETGKDEGCVGVKFKWRYADEAIKLIGENTDETNT